MSEENVQAEHIDENQLLNDDDNEMTTADAVSLFNSSLNAALEG
jgi:hypothetical protein